MRAEPRRRRPWEALIIGAYGTEVSKRVDIFAAALYQEMRVEDLNDLDRSYEPPFSSPWNPVKMATQAWVQPWRQMTTKPVGARTVQS